AAGAVHGAGGGARHAKFVEHVAVEQKIHDLACVAVPRGVAAGDDDRRRAHVVQPFRRIAGRGRRRERPAAQPLGFGDIGRDDPRKAQKLAAQQSHAVFVQQRRPARRHQHRIDDYERQLQFLDGRGHRLDDRGVGEHADLGGVDGQVGRHRFDLRRNQIRFERRHRLDAARALNRDRGDRAGAVDAVRRKRFQIGLDAGAAARIAPRNCQRYSHGLTCAVVYLTLLSTIAGRTDARVRAAGQAAAVVLVTALTAIAAQVSLPLPFTPVPFTFQPMVVLVGAMVLGSRLGAASQALYLALGIAGLPIFAASPLLPQGAARLIGPTGGYLLSYPLAAFVTGWLAERGFDRRYLTSIAAMSLGLAIVYAGGVAWLTIASQPARSIGAALAAGVVPFVLPDIFKLIVAAGVMPGLWKITGPIAR